MRRYGLQMSAAGPGSARRGAARRYARATQADSRRAMAS